MKLPIRSLGLVAAGLLLGTALAPVAAQGQQSGVDGQVALRSDGAVYLISNGQRRWVATVVISDDEINAYPEGEPIFTGLAPIGSAQVASNNPQQKPSNTPQQQQQQSGSSTQQPGNTSAKPTATQPPQPTQDPNSSADIPVEVDIDGSAKIERGEKRRVDIKTRKDATCELVVKLPGGKELTEDSKNADTSGRCTYNIEIPNDAPVGAGVMVGTAREGGRFNTHQLDFEVVED